jgi:type II secretory pathway pseudopilin PulG
MAAGGFTLIEAVATLAIAAILGAVALPRLVDSASSARSTALNTALGGTRTAIVLANVTSTYVSQTLTLEGRLDGALLYSASFGITDTAALHVPLAWTGIDTLVIIGSTATYWVMDDFAYEPHPLAVVPPPLPLLSAATGLLALLLVAGWPRTARSRTRALLHCGSLLEDKQAGRGKPDGMACRQGDVVETQ